ncbi:MAG: electron transport complex subunit RsxG [Methylophilaceae bacterium]|nr:electron transport complex subunit RsxG [Methylophilaceae bacterium]
MTERDASESITRHALATAAIMTGFSLLATVMLVSMHFATRAPIAESEREAKLRLLEQVLPHSLYDNDLLQDSVRIAPGGELGNRDHTLAYRARLEGAVSAVILEATAPDGYSGDIRLLVAIRADGTLAGVRVLAHKETPGLGDYIDIAHSDWIRQNFDGQSLAKTPDDAWKVKKDGGQFDYMAGATITPRAVVKAVHKTLKYFDAHRQELLAAPAAKE